MPKDKLICGQRRVGTASIKHKIYLFITSIILIDEWQRI